MPEYVLARFVVAVPGVALLAIVTTLLVVFPARLNGPVIYGLDLFVSLLVAEGFMSLVAACVPHYIIGIALAAGIFGFHMLCEGFFKVKSELVYSLQRACGKDPLLGHKRHHKKTLGLIAFR